MLNGLLGLYKVHKIHTEASKKEYNKLWMICGICCKLIFKYHAQIYLYFIYTNSEYTYRIYI